MCEHTIEVLTTYLILCGMVEAVLGNGCCAQIGMPWFYRKLPVPVADDFEVRICKNEGHGDEDIAIEKLELYVLS